MHTNRLSFVRFGEKGASSWRWSAIPLYCDAQSNACSEATNWSIPPLISIWVRVRRPRSPPEACSHRPFIRRRGSGSVRDGHMLQRETGGMFRTGEPVSGGVR
jgi:hypothetical protein